MIRIVVIDDSRADQALIAGAFRDALEGDSYELHSLEDGERALEFLKERADRSRPDLIVLDLNLPGKHGFEVLTEIKSNPKLKNIPVVVFSTSESEEDVAKAYYHFANSYIIKPMDLTGLYSVIHELKRYWLDTVAPPRMAAV